MRRDFVGTSEYRNCPKGTYEHKVWETRSEGFVQYIKAIITMVSVLARTNKTNRLISTSTNKSDRFFVFSEKNCAMG